MSQTDEIERAIAQARQLITDATKSTPVFAEEHRSLIDAVSKLADCIALLSKRHDVTQQPCVVCGGDDRDCHHCSGCGIEGAP